MNKSKFKLMLKKNTYNKNMLPYEQEGSETNSPLAATTVNHILS